MSLLTYLNFGFHEVVASEAFEDFQIVLYSDFRVARPTYRTPTAVTIRHLKVTTHTVNVVQ